MNVIEGPYLRDILDQPRALAATIDALAVGDNVLSMARKLRAGAYARVILTGMGSSLHALVPLEIALAEAGFTPLLVETSELVHSMPRLLDAGSLIVAVSQSGRSAEIVRLLEIRSADAALIGVTNTARSPLGQRSDAVVLTRAGEEFSVSCKTYVTALAALQILGSALRGCNPEVVRRELGQSAPAVAQYLEDWRDHVHQLAGLLDGVRHLFLAGRGTSLAAARTGALILKESAHVPVEGMSCAAFRHGPMEMLAADVLVLIFSGDEQAQPMNLRLCDEIRKAGGRAELAGAGATTGALSLPSVPPNLLPILEILPVEMLTLALASLKGIEAGRFSIASKVTTIE